MRNLFLRAFSALVMLFAFSGASNATAYSYDGIGSQSRSTIEASMHSIEGWAGDSASITVRALGAGGADLGLVDRLVAPNNAVTGGSCLASW
jgi:hypothetical protein